MNVVFLDAKTVGQPPNFKKLESLGSATFYPTTSPAEINARVADAEVIITNKVLITKEVIDSAPNLKLICVAATGTNNVDMDYAAEKNIPVKNVRDYSTLSVAQFTFNCLFYLIHQTSYYDEYVKTGKYCDSDIFTHIHHDFWEISGKTIGIIGLGAIGRQVAKIAQAFGATVVYYSTSGKNDNQEYRRLDLNPLLECCDVVSIHAPLNDATQGLIGTAQLSRMKTNAILINMGRGGIVDEKSLAEALDGHVIGGAVVDVLENEPMDRNNPLLGVKNKKKLLITPHIAWASLEARTTLIDRLCNHIASLKNG